MTDTNEKAIEPANVGMVEHEDNLHPIVKAIMKGKFSPDQIEALKEFSKLQIQHEDRMAQQAFNRAMVALKADLPTSLERDKEVDFKNQKGVRTHYWHTSLANAVDTVVGIMGDHGFTHRYRTDNTPQLVTVVCILSHDGGHSEKTKLVAPPDPKGGKNAPQAIASTTTLLQRYTLFAALGLASKDMKEPDDHKSSDDGTDELADQVDVETMLNAMARVGIDRDEIQVSLQKGIGEITTHDMRELRLWYRDRRKAEQDA